MDILDILGTAGGRRRRINNLAAGGRDLELSHPEGINTVLASQGYGGADQASHLHSLGLTRSA